MWFYPWSTRGKSSLFLKFRTCCLSASFFHYLYYLQSFSCLLFTDLFMYWEGWVLYWGKCLRPSGFSRGLKWSAQPEAARPEGSGCLQSRNHLLRSFFFFLSQPAFSLGWWFTIPEKDVAGTETWFNKKV